MRRRVLILGTVLTLATGLAASGPLVRPSSGQESEPAMKKLTPILVVDAIEPCLPFWTDRLGYARTAVLEYSQSTLGSFSMPSAHGARVP